VLDGLGYKMMRKLLKKQTDATLKITLKPVKFGAQKQGTYIIVQKARRCEVKFFDELPLHCQEAI
jgi:deferrochelatase/peroxidase EfeB